MPTPATLLSPFSRPTRGWWAVPTRQSRSRRVATPLLVFALFASLFLLPAAHAAETPSGRAHIRGLFLHVETGDYHVRFWEKAAWTLASVNYQGHSLLTHTGAYHSVLKVRGEGKSEWIGSGHGGEQIESLTLEIDGVAHPIGPELSVTGTTFTLIKVARMGPYQHTARVAISPEGITKHLDFRMIGPPLPIEQMYALMHCFSKAAEHWLVEKTGGEEERGTFTSDNQFTLRQDIRWAAVYAPTLGVGMTYVYPEVYAGHPPLRNAFWNRKNDNKLYLSVMPSQEAGATFGYQVRLQGFVAAPDTWEGAARARLTAE